MKKTILLLLFAGSLLSCSDDDASGTNVQFENYWAMTNFSAFMDAPMPQFEGNEVTWKIDEDNDKLIVVNQVEDEYPYLIASGTYDITLSQGVLSIDMGDFEDKYGYTFEGETLVLDSNYQGMVDGPIMHFDTVLQR